MLCDICVFMTDPPWPSGYDAWLPNARSLGPHQQVGLVATYIHVRCCGVLSMVLLQLKDPQLFLKRREFLLVSGFISSRYMI